jgi:hypothetical protein
VRISLTFDDGTVNSGTAYAVDGTIYFLDGSLVARAKAWLNL